MDTLIALGVFALVAGITVALLRMLPSPWPWMMIAHVLAGLAIIAMVMSYVFGIFPMPVLRD